VDVASTDASGDFKPPMTIQQVSASQETPQSEPDASAQTTSPAGPNPFDYDRDNYTWLRGTVEFDPEEKAWHIMYSENPDENDAFGGDLALMDHPQLATFHDDDVVLLMGRVDPESPDSLGKPRYRIERASKVIPSTDVRG
jgi:hypothetical protein